MDEMSPQEVLKHASSHPWILEGVKPKDIPKQYKNHPICPSCERIALRDKGWEKERHAQCPHCLRRFKADTTLQEYIEQKLYL